MIDNRNFIVYLTSCLPRKCGIATFTEDLCQAVDKIADLKFKSKKVALNDNGNSYDYSNDVLYQIQDKEINDYLNIAEKINKNDKIKLISVQHEFKIFGSDYGDNLLLFLNAVKKPVITTFHTVLPAPSKHRKEIIRLIAKNSSCLVVMNHFAIEILKKDYDIKDSKIYVIHHGIHDVTYKKNTSIKKELGYEEKQLIVSFGFLRPGKNGRSSGRGYEYVLDSLPKVIKKFPNLMYLIIGITHPNTIKAEGEIYRNFLENKVKKLGLEKNVKFINKFLPLKELLKHIQAADIYISSNLNPNQIVSGTLSYAMGCGKAIISTPYSHAKNMINPKRGILVNFKDSDSITNAITKILSNPKLRESMEINAYEFTRHMTWQNVALAYKNIFEEFIQKKEVLDKEMLHKTYIVSKTNV
jgi:glycosyltransferase involved in cell wall biosynthesis